MKIRNTIINFEESAVEMTYNEVLSAGIDPIT